MGGTRARVRGSQLGGFAAAVAVVVLPVGVAGLALGVDTLQPWVAVLFGINARMSGMSMGSLGVVKAIDVAVLALAGIGFAGFWPGPGRPHRVTMALAVLLPVAGIVVLLVSRLAGRSGLMGGALVLSALLIGARWYRLLGIVGVVANGLLLVGDFGTTGRASVAMAAVVGVGYLLLVAWLAWIAFVLTRGRAGPQPRG